MKKLFAVLAIAGLFSFGVSNETIAQTDPDTTEQNMTTEEMDQGTAAPATNAINDIEEQTPTTVDPTADGERSFHQSIKKTFIDGGPFFMSFVLITFILGLALCIERIIYLNMATINKNKFLENIENELRNGGVTSAKDLSRNTRGPIASIFYQGLERYDEGIDMVEKSVVAYGGVQMGNLEKGLAWISLFIALAPMLGFMGTVIGMIDAFDAIAAENNISPGIVAGGIKVALITTVAGLIVAIILQIFYNYIISKVDAIVNDMEDASISLIDILLRHNATTGTRKDNLV